MSLDRFVRFEKSPPKKEVELILTDYLNEVGLLSKEKNCWYITLPGKPSFPFRRIPGYETLKNMCESRDERWIEIHFSNKTINVLTRQMDEFTNNIADGIVQMLARFYKGNLES